MKGKMCMNCGEPMQGRSDKKFCDSYCRSNFNNNLKANHYTLVRTINDVLKKNRKILSGILGDEMETAKISREQLLERGFQFKYHTHYYKNHKGNVYVYCYDYGYLKLDEIWYLVVRDKR
ncbi:hypothetical protein GCM10007049_24550 [Echinicola pacifica]|uniref:DUF2116 family Zn-ribbon domain-containing protein n=1 Tax=Echinicola pacifica TaxID=346377 RepID=A0A918Q4Q5_9BACT|nr:hypothetical protein [Echinicola pacifica]GGZ30746.1 hypothetical protein GCM10007049_24550 [Echinicola pacifica]